MSIAALGGPRPPLAARTCVIPFRGKLFSSPWTRSSNAPTAFMPPSPAGKPCAGLSRGCWIISAGEAAWARFFPPCKTRSWHCMRWGISMTTHFVNAYRELMNLKINEKTLGFSPVSPVWDTAMDGRPGALSMERSLFCKERGMAGHRKFSSRETGRSRIPTAPPAAGRSSTATIFIPIPTTPPWF